MNIETGMEEYMEKAGNRTFSVMARAVDDALQNLRDAEQNVKDAEAFLNQQKAARDNARLALDTARDELFDAHPELAPSTPAAPAVASVVPQGGFEPIEVDDDTPPDFRLEFKETS